MLQKVEFSTLIPHSKELKTFQDLLIEIEKLQALIKLKTEISDYVRSRYFNEMPPLFDELKTSASDYVITLHEHANSFSLSKNEHKTVAQFITHFLDRTFPNTKLSDELKKIKSFWFYELNDSEINSEKTANSFVDKLLNDFNQNNYSVEKSTFYDENESFYKDDHPYKKRKSKREKEAETLKNKVDSAKSSSLKSIYKSLIRALHPDAELDETIQLEKTEVVKRITEAFRNKDLKSLIEIELAWIHKETAHIESLAKEAIEIYNLAFKDQVEALKKELDAIPFLERFSGLSHLIGKDKSESDTLLKKDKTNWKSYINYLNQHSLFFKHNYDKNVFIELMYKDLE